MAVCCNGVAVVQVDLWHTRSRKSLLGLSLFVLVCYPVGRAAPCCHNYTPVSAFNPVLPSGQLRLMNGSHS